MSRKPKNTVVVGAIDSLFSKPAETPLETTKSIDLKPLKSDDPLVQAFYDQLSPKEVIAHQIAVEKLGTSYDVVRTHGFVRWSKARAATASGSGGSGGK